ncbi:unnamed protein product [Euphydryas editha]|uniref:Trissin n=1 Tax=Euphydryas editha TaxID=104508 RepID=A0AAU9USW4_EUPED|nr:unnamed protein product [Euphydryas editha]
MFKIMAVVSLMLIGTTLWAASLSCDSCGTECASACGTRHFRSCCFNYLRKKRGPDSLKFLSHNFHDWTPEFNQKSKPVFIFEDAQQPRNIVPSDFNLYPVEDIFENSPQTYEK